MIFDPRPGSEPWVDLRGGVKIQLFDNMVISNWTESDMQQHGNKYFARNFSPPPPTLGVGSFGQNSTFSKYMVVLYIKFNINSNAATW